MSTTRSLPARTSILVRRGRYVINYSVMLAHTGKHKDEEGHCAGKVVVSEC